jgi:hypothetical protein
MRRIWASLAVAALLAVPVVAAADAPPDGTLVVKNGDGKVTMNGTGALIGTLDKGSVKLIDPAEGNTDDLVLRGCDNGSKASPTDNSIVCSGKDLRYRVVEGRFKVRINGTGINLSAVGYSVGDPGVTINGDPDLDDGDGLLGTYKVNDDSAKRITDKPITFALSG